MERVPGRPRKYIFDVDQPTQHKFCLACNSAYPLTQDYFYVDMNSEDKFNSCCRRCSSVRIALEDICDLALQVEPPFRVYVLRLKNVYGFYVGQTADIQTRLVQHVYGGGSRVTKRYGVDRLLSTVPCHTKSKANELERRMTVTLSAIAPTWGWSWTSLDKPLQS